jgi:hypothetical protein
VWGAASKTIKVMQDVCKFILIHLNIHDSFTLVYNEIIPYLHFYNILFSDNIFKDLSTLVPKDCLRIFFGICMVCYTMNLLLYI